MVGLGINQDWFEASSALACRFFRVGLIVVFIYQFAYRAVWSLFQVLSRLIQGWFRVGLLFV